MVEKPPCVSKACPRAQAAFVSSTNDDLFTFWTAPDDALFATPVIARVRNVPVALLEREHSLGTGPKYRKVSVRVLYRKADVLEWIVQQQERALMPSARLHHIVGGRSTGRRDRRPQQHK
jgi:hypothetical protein